MSADAHVPLDPVLGGEPIPPFRGHESEHVPLFPTLAWARPDGEPDRPSDAAVSVPCLGHETGAWTSRISPAVIVLLTAGLIAILWSRAQSHTLEAELMRLRESMRVQAQEQTSLHLSLEKEVEEARA